MDQVRWGMIGCGSVAEVKNGPGLYKAEHSVLRGVYSRRIDRARDYAERHGVPVVYESAEQLFADGEIDAVYLATPPQYHKQYALQCIAAGKIPYIEKPMATCYEDCAEILAAAKAKGLPVYVAFYRRGLPKFHKIKELIDAGTIGAVRYVDVRQIMRPEPEDLDPANLPWRVSPEAGGGKFLDMAVHVLDFLTYCFGDLTEMSGVAANQGGLYRVEDTVSGSFRFQSGVVGTGMWCYVAGFDLDEVMIVGDRGRISFAGMEPGGEVRIEADGKGETLCFDPPQHFGQPFIQTIVNELTGRGICPGNAQSAANGIRMMDAVLDGYRKTHNG